MEDESKKLRILLARIITNASAAYKVQLTGKTSARMPHTSIAPDKPRVGENIQKKPDNS